MIKVTSTTGIELKRFDIGQRGKGELLITGNTFAAGTYNYALIIDGKQIDSKNRMLSK